MKTMKHRQLFHSRDAAVAAAHPAVNVTMRMPVLRMPVQAVCVLILPLTAMTITPALWMAAIHHQDAPIPPFPIAVAVTPALG
jgi:hypothetical protein